jgi:hypothetical protein
MADITLGNPERHIPRLQAAIERLEQQRSAASSWPWWHQPWGGQNENGDYMGGDIFDGGGEYLVSDVRDQDGELICTLHRTIDAQLAILRFAVDGLYDLPEFLMLADAILAAPTSPDSGSDQ